MIRIKNIYYMLSYAFQILNEQGYKQLLTEKFDNTAELCAAILSKRCFFTNKARTWKSISITDRIISCRQRKN